MATALPQFRDFLAAAWQRCRDLPFLLRHVFFFILNPIARTLGFSHHANMSLSPHSKALSAKDDGGQRRMTHLKTKEECRMGNEILQVWTVEMPSKHAEGILKVIKDNVEGQDAVDLQHLRRFAKPKYLPTHVLGKRNVLKEMYAIPRSWESTPELMMQSPSTASWEWTAPARSRLVSNRPTTLHLLICPSNMIGHRELRELLLQYPPFCSSADSWAYPLEIKEITVPLLAPTSPEQANMWSAQYWPTFYRKTNPFGAHPGTIAKAEQELHHPTEGNTSIEEALELSHKVAKEMESRSFGAATGCVVLERVEGKTEIVAVAGDARYKRLPGAAGAETDNGACNANVMGHAVMRAIGMVARKRLRVASPRESTRAAKAERTFEACGLNHDEKARDEFFNDLPITALEQHYFEKDNIKADGYLCLRLEIILTHEPCMMCSMALVHSRVGRVIFEKRMPQTGGLTAEVVSNDSGPVGLGYGLCWRKELNWQFMCWEYCEPTPPEPITTARKKSGNVNHTAATACNGDHLSSSSYSQAVVQGNVNGAVLSDHSANVDSFASTHV